MIQINYCKHFIIVVPTNIIVPSQVNNENMEFIKGLLKNAIKLENPKYADHTIRIEDVQYEFHNNGTRLSCDYTVSTHKVFKRA